MIIRRMELSDIDSVVRTHLDAFPNFFLSSLGPRFLRQFYASVVRDPNGIAIIAAQDGHLLGFAAGTAQPGGFYRRLLRRRFLPVSLSLVPVLLRHPSKIFRVARRAITRASNAAIPEGSELMSIAVATTHQGKGVGRALVDAFVGQAPGTVWLLTDAEDNERVTRFYESADFERRRSITTAEGRKMHEYAKPTDSSSFLPFAKPDIGDEEFEGVRRVLESGWLTTGERARQFEEQFAAAVGAKHAIALCSGTAALHLALDAIGLQAGDEVIVPDYTFTATAEVVFYFRAKPVIVDVQRQSLNIDPAAIERAITPRTKAIIPVHFGGLPADLDAIHAIADPRGIAVIEDAAHAFPARYRGRTIGATDHIVCFSFYATKTITTGEGGMLCTNSDAYAERVRLMSLHGISRDAWKRYREDGSWFYEVVAPGFKYNMTDIAAAIGLAQLGKAQRMRRRRQEIADRYDAAIPRDIFEPPSYDAPDDHAWHLYPLRLHLDRLTIGRDDFIRELRAAGVGSSVHFIPLHLHPFYRKELGFRADDFPVSAAEYAREVSLPIYSSMGDADVARVIDAVSKIGGRVRR